MLFNSKSTIAVPAATALMALLALGTSAVPTANLHGDSMAKLHHRQTAASSDVSPTAPGPGDKFKAGGDCTTEWSAGSGAAWKNFDIDLMTGSNTQMTKLATVASGLDGSGSTTSITFKCPEVSPYSAIYFYQYTPKGTSSGDPSWTTRFTITDASGNSVAEPQKVQPDGKAIPWGTGKLVGSITPATGGSSGSSASGSSSSTGSSSASGSSSAASSPSSTSTSPASSSSSSVQAASTNASQQSSTASTGSSGSSGSNAATSSKSSTSTTSGAMTNVVSGNFLGGVVAAFAAASFLV